MKKAFRSKIAAEGFFEGVDDAGMCRTV